MRETDHAFNKLLRDALELIPEEFRPYLENVAIVVEDWPSRDVLMTLGIPEEKSLYGLYVGTPLTERHFGYVALPDRIILYQSALQADFPNPEELRREVALTLLHEIAHHLGLDEKRLGELGLD